MGETMIVRVHVPVRLVSEANVSSSEHWRVRAGRARDQRALVSLHLAPHKRPSVPCVVSMQRLAPRAIRDDDNHASCFKHVRDAVAGWLGVDDSSPLVIWHVLPHEKADYAARITIASISQEQLDAYREACSAASRLAQGWIDGLYDRGTLCAIL